jgi:hypothetical protein
LLVRGLWFVVCGLLLVASELLLRQLTTNN